MAVSGLLEDGFLIVRLLWETIVWIGKLKSASASKTVLDDYLWQGVYGVRDPGKLNFPELDIIYPLTLELSHHFVHFPKPTLEGFQNQSIIFPSNRKHRIQVVLNVGPHRLNLPLTIDEFGEREAGSFLGVLPLEEDMVIAFIFLEFQGLDDSLEIFVDFFDLLAVKLLRRY